MDKVKHKPGGGDKKVNHFSWQKSLFLIDFISCLLTVGYKRQLY